SATFSGEARFTGATFSGDAQFGSATFSGYAQFGSATFSGEAEFVGATFSGEAGFYSATFSGEARFTGATFSGEAWFTGATFSGDAWFHSATFVGVPHFDNACFLSRMVFHGAVFERQASFKELQWVSGTDKEGKTWKQAEKHWRRAFYTAEFKGPVDFEGAGAQAFAAFDGARLERGITFDKPKASDVDAAFRRQIDFVKQFPAPDAQPRKRRWFGLLPPAPEPDVQVGLEALEGGCRVLKQAFAGASDSVREQQFYRYEVIARRKQKATPWTEKLFSYLYGWTASYGASIGRPVVAVFAVVALFAVIYWLAKVGLGPAGAAFAAIPAGGPIDPSFRDALEFSFSRVFPFGAFEEVSKEWIAAFEPGAEDTLWTLLLRIVASVQSALALALVFVFGLAVRRKFQIN
ncbi:MAG: pentapeptide repeat-containing protein, partial [Caulobacterales bacterium]